LAKNVNKLLKSLKNLLLGICEQSCRNYHGSYRCSCKRGYRLNHDGKTCSEIDECSENDPNHLCPGTATCKNIIGSYKCSCPNGFKSLNSGSFCLGKKTKQKFLKLNNKILSFQTLMNATTILLKLATGSMKFV
jgi:Complement Clr-like EGF-like